MTTNTQPKTVTFTRADVLDQLSSYRTIRDVLAGEPKVKSKRELYLPNPSPPKCETEEATSRYEDYLKRAVFYNAPRRTMTGLVGMIFTKHPQIEAPGLEALIDNASGDGVSLVQQSKLAAEQVLGYSRAGLLVDYSAPSDSTPTKAEEESGSRRATITLYDAQEIRNWRIQTIGSEDVLQLVVLRERHEVPAEDSEFAIVREYWFREVRLSGGVVTQRMWRPAGRMGDDMTIGQINQTEYKAGDAVTVKGASGEPLKRIPFFPMGLTSNGWNVEPPAFYDLASLSLAHYRNSADYEESCFVTGQVTPFFAGITAQDVQELNNGALRIGSRGGVIASDASAKAELLQAEPNAPVKEAMDQKERQMVALGAKLVEEKGVQQTATQAKIENTADGSTLQSAARNVSAAYTRALEACYLFTGGAGEVTFKLNDDFDISKMSAQEITAFMAAIQKGDLAWSEGRNVYRALGWATLDDKVAEAEIDKRAEKAMAREVDAAAALTKATAENDPNADGPPTS